MTPFNLSKRSGVKIGIDMSDFCEVSAQNKLNIAAIRAIDEIESAGSGFLSSSLRPKILFEGHYFYKLAARLGLAEKFRKAEPTICYPTWTKAHYLGREGEYGRLAKATELCHKFEISDSIALRSASWGRYQIMGENFRDAGFDDVEDFVEAHFQDEDNHLEAFIIYLKNAFLMDDLQNLPKNPAKYAQIIASGYNGPGYRRNAYDTKLVAAFRRFSKQQIDCGKALAGIHVVQAMPGLRASNPSEIGIENTSLDDRYIDLSANDPENENILNLPEAGGGSMTEPIFKAEANREKESEVPAPAPIPGAEAPAPVQGSQIAVGGGDITQSSPAAIQAAKELPDTVIQTKAKTGFLAKITAAITAIMTGQYIVPDFVQNGLQNINLAELIGRLFEGIYRWRYILIGAIALWFIVNQLKDSHLKSLAIKTNTDPAKGNVVLVAPKKLTFIQWIKSKLGYSIEEV